MLELGRIEEKSLLIANNKYPRKIYILTSTLNYQSIQIDYQVEKVAAEKWNNYT